MYRKNSMSRISFLKQHLSFERSSDCKRKIHIVITILCHSNIIISELWYKNIEHLAKIDETLLNDATKGLQFNILLLKA